MNGMVSFQERGFYYKMVKIIRNNIIGALLIKLCPVFSSTTCASTRHKSYRLNLIKQIKQR